MHFLHTLVNELSLANQPRGNYFCNTSYILSHKTISLSFAQLNWITIDVIVVVSHMSLKVVRIPRFLQKSKDAVQSVDETLVENAQLVMS
jgi:hypothetical protein